MSEWISYIIEKERRGSGEIEEEYFDDRHLAEEVFKAYDDKDTYGEIYASVELLEKNWRDRSGRSLDYIDFTED